MSDQTATTQEIARAMKLTDRAVRKHLAGVPCQTRAIRGGRQRVYRVEDLPEAMRLALALSSGKTASSKEPQKTATRVTPNDHAGLSSGDAGLPDGGAGSTPKPRADSLSARIEARSRWYDSRPEKEKAYARRAFDALTSHHRLRAAGCGAGDAIETVAKQTGVSESSVRSWLKKTRGVPCDAWLFFLARDYPGRTATAGLSAEGWEFLKAEYLTPERRSAAACIDRLHRAAKGRGWAIPSTRTLLRRLDELPRAVRVLAREGKEAAMRLYPAQARSISALSALSIVNGDGYKHNLWVRFPDGEVLRPKTWFWQDVYSSKILGWRVDKTEHTDVIRLSFGDIVERFGIPEKVLLDNTLAAANKTMSGGIRHRFRFKVREEEPFGVFMLLIGHDPIMWATPRHGQAKPIERAFGHGGIGEYVDKAPEFAGAWTGSSIIDKPDYDGRKHRAVDVAQLRAVIEREVAAWNAREGRRSHLAKGRSFDAVFEESYARITVRRATEAQRRLWLLATEEIPVARDGTVALDSGRLVGERLANRYFSAHLVDHVGRKVCARFDPQRLHQGVHIYTADGRYICFADCVDPAAFNDQGAAREHQRNRKTFVRAARVQLQAERRMDELSTSKLLPGIAPAAMAHAAIAAPKVVRAEFRDPLERPRVAASQRSAEERSELEQLEADMAKGREVNVHELRSDADKHAHWKTLAARRAGGEVLPDAQQQFWAAWQGSEYFRLEREANAEFEQRLQGTG